MNDKYKLEGHKAVVCDDLMEWAEWFETAKRHVEKTDVGDARVSPVFLGMNHNFGEGGKPLLFETMVFGGEYDEEMEQYATWEQAEEGHNRWVEKLKGKS